MMTTFSGIDHLPLKTMNSSSFYCRDIYQFKRSLGVKKRAPWGNQGALLSATNQDSRLFLFPRYQTELGTRGGMLFLDLFLRLHLNFRRGIGFDDFREGLFVVGGDRLEGGEFRKSHELPA